MDMIWTSTFSTLNRTHSQITFSANWNSSREHLIKSVTRRDIQFYNFCRNTPRSTCCCIGVVQRKSTSIKTWDTGSLCERPFSKESIDREDVAIKLMVAVFVLLRDTIDGIWMHLGALDSYYCCWFLLVLRQMGFGSIFGLTFQCG